MNKRAILMALMLALAGCSGDGATTAPAGPSQADAPATPAVGSDCIDPAKVDPARVCTMDWQPVCGCDGKTYGNVCVAEGAGVQRWTEGECSGSAQ